MADFNTDAFAIVQGARAFADSTSLKSWFRTGEDFVADISKIMTLDNVEILIAEDEGEIVGGIGIAYIPFIWNQTILIADELFWWTFENAPFRTGKALFDTAMKRIAEKGAIPMFRSLDTSPEHIGAFYEREGLSMVESVYTRID